MGLLKSIHSDKEEWSSKRVYGGIMLLVVMVCVLMNNQHPLLEPMLYTGAGLIGFGTTVKIAEALKKTPTPPANETI